MTTNFDDNRLIREIRDVEGAVNEVQKEVAAGRVDLRDLFAAHALGALIARRFASDALDRELLAQEALAYADAMLRVRGTRT